MNAPIPILAITLWQPWASAIIAGVKPCENRTWIPRQLRGALPWGRAGRSGWWLAIHAGRATDRQVDLEDLRELWPTAPHGHPRSWPRGLLGLARFDSAGPIEAFPELGANPWACGPMVWNVGRVLRLEEPIPCSGAQGLWPVPEGLAGPLRELYLREGPP